MIRQIVSEHTLNFLTLSQRLTKIELSFFFRIHTKSKYLYKCNIKDINKYKTILIVMSDAVTTFVIVFINYMKSYDLAAIELPVVMTNKDRGE